MSDDNTQPNQALPDTLFQTKLSLTDGSTVNVVVSNAGDTVNFYLDRQVTHEVFGPEQIVEVLIRLQILTTTLNKYVSDRVTEAKASIETAAQPELNFADGLPTENEACENGTCNGGCSDSEVATHACQPE